MLWTVCVVCLLCVFVPMFVCMDSLLCTQIVHTVVNLPILAPQWMKKCHMNYMHTLLNRPIAFLASIHEGSAEMDRSFCSVPPRVHVASMQIQVQRYIMM